MAQCGIEATVLLAYRSAMSQAKVTVFIAVFILTAYRRIGLTVDTIFIGAAIVRPIIVTTTIRMRSTVALIIETYLLALVSLIGAVRVNGKLIALTKATHHAIAASVVAGSCVAAYVRIGKTIVTTI